MLFALSFYSYIVPNKNLQPKIQSPKERLIMIKNTNRPCSGIFRLEVILTSFIPFIIWWMNIPTNILNSNPWLGLPEFIGLLGITLIFFAGIPVGIIGIRKAKEMKKRRVATIVLSLINLSAGIIEVVILILIFSAVLLGVSV